MNVEVYSKAEKVWYMSGTPAQEFQKAEGFLGNSASYTLCSGTIFQVFFTPQCKKKKVITLKVHFLEVIAIKNGWIQWRLTAWFCGGFLLFHLISSWSVTLEMS